MKHSLSAEIGIQHPGLPDPFRRAREHIRIDHDKVGEFARLQRADLGLPEKQEGVVDRV